jgi:[ribosomal protein S18]-alanine N-acetyltransferase
VAAQGGPGRGDERPAAKPPTQLKPLSVDRLAHGDIPDICALYKRVWEGNKELPAELTKAWQPTALEFSSWMEGITYFAARREGRMIGAIGCEIKDGSCRLVHLAVDPEARRQGVATALGTAAVEWARRSSCKSVWVDTLDRFTGATALLKSLGFADSGVLHRHLWGEDVRLSEKLL